MSSEVSSDIYGRKFADLGGLSGLSSEVSSDVCTGEGSQIQGRLSGMARLLLKVSKVVLDHGMEWEGVLWKMRVWLVICGCVGGCCWWRLTAGSAGRPYGRCCPGCWW